MKDNDQSWEDLMVASEKPLKQIAEKTNLIASFDAGFGKTTTRELFTGVEESFSREEARVLREGNDIIIRLIGLNFSTAKATIEQQSFGLLTKVRDAINSFPKCTVSVLSNTDSYGGDEQNLHLSKERAVAVKQYREMYRSVPPA